MLGSLRVGDHMFVHVTHVDDSPRGREGPCIHFWGTTESTVLHVMNKLIEDIRNELETRQPPTHQNVLMDQICCVLIRQHWHRAKLTQLKLSQTGTLDVYLVDTGAIHEVPLAFIRTLDFSERAREIRSFPAIAMKFILSDIVAHRGLTCNQWSDFAISFLKVNLENLLWKAVYLGDFGEAKGVRLYDQRNQLFATTLLNKGLGVPTRTYIEAVSSTQPNHQELMDNTPAFLKPAFPPLCNTRLDRNLPPAFAIPVADRGHHLFTFPVDVSSQLSYGSPFLSPKEYVINEIPHGRHEVLVSHVADGPSKFYVVMKRLLSELNNLRHNIQIESISPRRLSEIPCRGSVCLAVSPSDKRFHRGLVTSKEIVDGQCSVYFVDIGIQEIVGLDSICHIPDELMALPMFAMRVSLNRAEELSELGLSAIFSALVNQGNYLQCEVVASGVNPKVNLYDQAGRGIIDTLLSVHSHISTVNSSSAPSRPGSATLSHVFEISDPELNEEETICVVFTYKPGFFFGQLEKFPMQDLDNLNSEMTKFYSANPSPALLYSDVKSHLGHVGVYQWTDNDYYRVRITKELVHDSEILFIDYGNTICVPRELILTPVESLSHFQHAPFGFRCSFENDVALSEVQWKDAMFDKSIHVKIGKCTEGIYSVMLTDHPSNTEIGKALVISQKPSSTQLTQELISPEILGSSDDRRKRNNDYGNTRSQNVRSGYGNYVHPNAKDSNWRTPSSSPVEEGTAQPKANDIKETNWRSTTNSSQEVIRAPRGPPPSNGKEENKGPTGFLRQAPVVKPLPAKEPPTAAPNFKPEMPSAPPPTPTSAPAQKRLYFRKQQDFTDKTKPIEVVYVTSPSHFYVQLHEYYDALENMANKLNAVYSDSSKPAIQNATVGLACVMKFEEDHQWYRGQILDIQDQIVNVLFVDYGNTQKGPIKEVKAIDEEFVQLPPQAILCRLCGVGNSRTWTAEETTLFETSTTDKILEAKFASRDSEKYLVSLREIKEGGMLDVNEMFGVPSSPSRNCFQSLPTTDSLSKDVSIAWYYNPLRFFTSPLDCSPYQAKLDELEEFYSSLSAKELVEDQPSEGLPCVVRYTEDQRFYRSQILSIRGQIAKVLFVDYGNEQDTPLADLKRIIPRFMELPQLTWQCKLSGVKIVSPMNPDSKKYIDSSFLSGNTVSAKFHQVEDGVFNVDLCVTQVGDVKELLLKQHILVHDPVVEEDRKLVPQILDFLPGQEISSRATVPYFLSFSEFWINLDPKAVDDLMEQLDQLALDPEFLNKKNYCPAVGKLCLAFFDDDGRWYRAVIKEINNDTATVYYLDFGNSSSVKTSDLRSIPAEFASFPALAYLCGIDGAEDLSDEATMAFEKACYDLKFKVNCSRIDDGKLHVRLFSLEGKDLTEMSSKYALHPIPETLNTAAQEISEEVVQITANTVPDLQAESIVGLEVPAQSNTEPELNEVIQPSMEIKEAEVYLSYSVPPNRFWFQLKKNASQLDEMQDELFKLNDGSSSQHEVPLLITDEWYAINHPIYESWYRAQIKDVVEDTVVAYFVDYGDTHVVPIANVRVLPMQFRETMIPAMAIPTIPKKNSTDLFEKFNTMCIDTEAVLLVEFGTDENGHKVIESMYIEDKNLLEIPATPTDVLPESATELEFKSKEQDMLPTIQEELYLSTTPNLLNSPLIPNEDQSQVQYADRVPQMDLSFVPGEKMSTVALVTHIESATEIWIQLDPDAVHQLMKEISTMIDIPLVDPQTGRHCLALFPGNGKWYRAIVDDIDGDQVAVTYIDYGNSSKIGLDCLKALPTNIAQQPGLAVKCALDAGEFPNFNVEKWKEVLDEEVFTVVFVCRTPQHILVRLTDMTGSDMSDKLAKMSVEQFEVQSLCLSQIDVEMASITSTTISEPSDDVTLPLKIVPEPDDDVTLPLEIIHEPDVTLPLEVVFETFPLQVVVEETEYVNESQPENILQPENLKECEVAVNVEQTCDYRNSFPHFMSLEQDAQKLCSTPQEDFVEFNRDVTMESLTHGDSIIPEIVTEDVEKNDSTSSNSNISQNDSVYRLGQHTPPPERVNQLFVVACQTPQHVDNLLVENDDEKDVPIPSEERVLSVKIEGQQIEGMHTADLMQPVYISHIASSGEIWIQLAENEQNIGDIDCQLQEMGIATDLEHQLEGPPVVGQLYAVKHPEFGFWYRGLLTKQGVEDAVVCFIDYGDSHNVFICDIRKLPKILVKVPNMAFPCKFSNGQLDHSPPETIDVLKNICKPEKLCKALFGSKTMEGITEVESLFVGDINVLDLLVADMRELIPSTISPPVSPSQSEPYSTAGPLVEAVTNVKMEIDSLETVTEFDTSLSVQNW